MTSMPQYKRCSHCQELKLVSEFGKRRQSRDGLQAQCKTCHLEYEKWYRSTDRGRIVLRQIQQRYTQSPGGKQVRRRYYQSPRVKKMQKQWRQSPKGVAYARRVRQSPKRMAYMKAYMRRRVLLGENAKWHKEYYHRIQGEAQCHSHIDDFLPAYRKLIKPLLEGHYKFVDVKY